MPIEQLNARVVLGHVKSRGVMLQLSLHISPDRTATLEVFMTDENSRRTGEMLVLGYVGAHELKELIDHASGVVGRMAYSGQIAGLARDR